jgi:putative heme-binding domain-containing protein
LLVLYPDRVPTLLEAIERGQLNRGDLTARQVQRVCLHKDDDVRERAVRLLSPARPGKRADVIAAYQSALSLEGDVSRGRDVFRKVCATCHKAEGVGHELGPNLVTFSHRGPEAILASVLDPNREVNPLYATYTVVTTEGLVLTGMLTAETSTAITLTREEGKTDTILRGDIEELRANNVSLMPEGLEEKIDQQALADVTEYLLSLR